MRIGIRYCLPWLACLFMLAPLPLRASYISMVPRLHIDTTPTVITIKLSIENQGNEDSLKVHPFLALGAQEVHLDPVPHVAFEGARNFEYRFERSDLHLDLPGVYPLFLRIHYHDANLYPFSMPFVQTVCIDRCFQARDIAADVEARPLDKTGSITVSLTNKASERRRLHLRLFSAQELLFSKDSHEVFLGPKAHKTLTVSVSNNGALDGSSYPVYAVLQYPRNNKHMTVLASDRLSIQRSAHAGAAGGIFAALLGGVALLFCLTLGVEWTLL